MGDIDNVKTVRDIIDEFKYAWSPEKVEKRSPLAREIGQRVKLHLQPGGKVKRPNDDYLVNCYPEACWPLMRIITRVTVAEYVIAKTPRPASPFTVDQSLDSSIFGTDKGATNIIIKPNDTTRKYLWSLLRFDIAGNTKLKQSFPCEPERVAYTKRIIALLNRIWMPGPHEALDLSAEPYIWCKEKDGSIDKVIASLTEILHFGGAYAWTTLERIAEECRLPLDNALRSILHYILEYKLGYEVYKRVLIKDSGTTVRSPNWPNDDWPSIALTRDEATMAEYLLRTWYRPPINQVPFVPAVSGVEEGREALGPAEEGSSLKRARL